MGPLMMEHLYFFVRKAVTLKSFKCNSIICLSMTINSLLGKRGILTGFSAPGLKILKAVVCIPIKYIKILCMYVVNGILHLPEVRNKHIESRFMSLRIKSTDFLPR